MVKFIFVDKKLKIGGWSLVGWSAAGKEKNKIYFFIFPNAKRKKYFFILFFYFLFFVVWMLMQLFFYGGGIFLHARTHGGGGGHFGNFDTHNFDSRQKMKP